MKVGDRVRILSSVYCHEELQPGKAGVAVAVRSEYVELDMDSGHKPSDGSTWAFLEHELELIQ